MSIFNNKNDAIKYYNNISNNDLLLFQEDISISGKKKFIISEPENIFNNIMNKEESNYYEFWNDKNSISFGMDIDITENMSIIESRIVINKIIINVINGVKILYDKEINTKDIYVLQSNIYKDKCKISYHVIFKNLIFKNYTYCKDFFINLKLHFDMKYCDESIYGLKCFRTCFSSKKGINNVLVPIRLKILDNEIELGNTCFPENKDIMTYWKNTLITYINNENSNNIYINNYIKIKNEKQIKINYDNDLDNDEQIFNIDKIKNILFSLPSKYYDDYESWISVGFILHNMEFME